MAAVGTRFATDACGESLLIAVGTAFIALGLNGFIGMSNEDTRK